MYIKNRDFYFIIYFISLYIIKQSLRRIYLFIRILNLIADEVALFYCSLSEFIMTALKIIIIEIRR